ncbi:hypothetical protein AWW66_16065 [Micromonospora rosaria]|uniref:Uncharacterized protein n=1 Tax=Micromonospora rosaria TaxID=47874 RepID=A0A136PR72_9ACTN|nr:hypothetical protein [Micromonospora rosaria]KXK60940.1 hypothetical protein AWW66_16065 [Micromonospora rosaria]
MNSPLEEALRAAVRDLADQAPRLNPELAAGALQRGRRRRTRRRVAVAGAAVLAVLAVLLPAALLRPERPLPPAGPEPTPTTTPELLPAPDADWTGSPLALPGDWVVTGALRGGTGWVLDRARSRYLPAEGYDAVWPAPRGGFSAVVDHDRRPGQVGLVDLARERITWIDTGQGAPGLQWSPDGRRLVLTLFDKEAGTTRIGVLETSGRLRSFPLDHTRYFCTDQCGLTWARNGREVVLPQTEAFAPRSESARHPRRGVQLFSAEDGRPTRFLPIPGDPAGPWSWSPDDRLVVVQGQTEPLLVRTDTGQVLRTLPDPEAALVTDGRLLYRRDSGRQDFVLAEVSTGRELQRQPVPEKIWDLTFHLAPP